MKIVPAGENALILYFADHMDPEVSARVRRAEQVLERELGKYLIDLVPSYASLLVIYDLYRTDFDALSAETSALLTSAEATAASGAGNLIELPVYYDSETGPDLDALARRTGLSPEDVVTLHQNREYHVYAIGFAPGFAYLGAVDDRIAAPRLATPRPKVEQGSVGIAGRQTAVYPSASPGGWNLIGRCPLPMFNLLETPPMPMRVGDRVRFYAINREQYLELGGVL